MTCSPTQLPQEGRELPQPQRQRTGVAALATLAVARWAAPGERGIAGDQTSDPARNGQQKQSM